MKTSQPGESSVTTGEIDALQREIHALQAALRRARLLRAGVLVAAIAVVLVVSWATLTRLRDFASERNMQALSHAASLRLDKNRDFYMRHLETLTNKVGPVISEAFLEQAKKDMPLYLKSVEAQKQPLLDNLEREFSTALDRRYGSIRPELEAILLQEYPQLKNQKLRDDLLANVDQAMQRMRKKYYVQDLHNEVNGLFSTWDQFPPAEAVGPSGVSLEDQFVAALLELLTYKLTHAQRTASLK
jgi:hypothetical protein